MHNGKTKSRLVPIHPILRPWLEALRQSNGPVIEPWQNDKADLRRACERAGVPRVTPNDLRRTFATWLKQSDVDSAVVAAMMGHAPRHGRSRLRQAGRTAARLLVYQAESTVTPVSRRTRKAVANMAQMAQRSRHEFRQGIHDLWRICSEGRRTRYPRTQ